MVGTHGRTGLGKLLLGSVAEDILRHASCPVLTVGPRCRDARSCRHFRIGQRSRSVELELRQIVFATNFAQNAARMAQEAVWLAEEFPPGSPSCTSWRTTRISASKPGPDRSGACRNSGN